MSVATKHPRPALSRQRIEEVAAELIEREGLEVFSTRRLAAELHCEAMSIYHHFPNKAQLLDALVGGFFERLQMPDRELLPVERLRRLAWSYREAALQQPNLFPLVATHRLSTPVGIAWLERMFGVLLDAVPQRETATRLIQAYGSYIVGACLDETQRYAKGASRGGPLSSETMERDFPNVAAAEPFLNREHDRANFGAGLELILSGIEQSFGRAPAQPD